MRRVFRPLCLQGDDFEFRHMLDLVIMPASISDSNPKDLYGKDFRKFNTRNHSRFQK